MSQTAGDELAGSEMMDPAVYAREGYPHASWTRLRRESPVHRYESFEFPFWLLSRRAEIVEVSRQPELYSNHPRFQIVAGSDFASGDAREPETIIHMDPPRHRVYRDLISRRFTPRALASVKTQVFEIARSLLDKLAEEATEGDIDFVARIAAPLPIAVIARLLDVPETDWPQLFDWTNAIVAPADREYQRPGESAHETRLRASNELYCYFGELAAQRRKGDGDDLVSLLARAEVSGAPLAHHELVSYYLLLVAAGNETTRNAISAGLLAFLEHPHEWRRFAADPGLDRPAGEEILRWTTPVVQMARTALEDVELGGKRIAKGDTLALFYASANRDEQVFDEPFRFRIDRDPNPHLAFGVGEHFCIGAHLARLEIQVLFRQLARSGFEVEQAGPIQRLQSCNLGGLKSFPIRYRMPHRNRRHSLD